MRSVEALKSGMLIGVGFLSIVSVAYAAISWPATPSGETAGGKYSAKLVPTGFIGAFNLSSCPTGWSDYTPAYGRFLRGIDKSGTNIDSDGLRVAGAIQGDEFRVHSHGIGSKTIMIGGATWGPSDVGGGADNGWGGTGPIGGAETRPKNVAVLYCVKD